MSAIDRLNNKIIKGKKHSYQELQHTSLYAHNTTSNEFKSLLVNDAESLVVSDSNISKGQDVKGVGEGLQQVLIYGRKPDGTLQPLESSGDRLLVDVLELSHSGPISTSTALSSVQVCGYDHDNTSRFKTLRVNTDGKLHTLNNTNNAGSFGNIINNASLTAGSFSSSVDVSNMNKAYILYEDSSVASMDPVDIQISCDNTNFYQVLNFQPFAGFGALIRESTAYLDLNGITHLRIRNVSPADTYANVKASVVGSA